MLDAVGGEAYYSVDYPEFTLVALDSLIPGSPAGRLGDAQLSWLDEVLRRRPDVPALVGLHHPPMPVGIRFLDGMRLLDGDDLRKVVASHPHVARVMAGHVHRSITAGFAQQRAHRRAESVAAGGAALRLRRAARLHRRAHRLSAAHDRGGDDCVTHSVQVSHTAALLGAY
nr:hypothetical protein GCM10020092_010170 [Actinoplanes digitatis]